MIIKTRSVSCFLSMSVLSLLATVGLADGAQAPPDRSDIKTEDTWNLQDMYASQDAWKTHRDAIEALVGELAARRGTAGESPEQLLAVLQLHDRINAELDKLYAYASMNFDQDMRQPSEQAIRDRARSLVAEYAESRAWLEPELTGLPREKVDAWLERDDLAVYRHFFDNLFRRSKHILSPREEELLAMASKTSSASANTFRLLTNTELQRNTIKDSDGKNVIVTDAVYYDLISSKDRRVRKDVYLALHRSYMDVKSSLASTLEGAAQRDWFYAKARGYNSSLEAALDQENLPVGVYHNLIDTINKHLPLLHRYTALRKKVLELDEVHPYDLYVSLVDAPEQRYTYERARQLIIESLEPIGKEYVDALKVGFDSRWVDVYENKGKRSGAYCSGAYLVHPYVLLNFKGNYDGVSTVAHEMGHAMQSHFANTTQPPVYADYPMFTAEVASTAAEIVFNSRSGPTCKTRPPGLAIGSQPVAAKFFLAQV